VASRPCLPPNGRSAHSSCCTGSCSHQQRVRGLPVDGILRWRSSMTKCLSAASVCNRGFCSRSSGWVPASICVSCRAGPQVAAPGGRGQAVVIGAGPAGVAAAMSLSRQGFAVRVLERRGDPTAPEAAAAENRRTFVMALMPRGSGALRNVSAAAAGTPHRLISCHLPDCPALPHTPRWRACGECASIRFVAPCSSPPLCLRALLSCCSWASGSRTTTGSAAWRLPRCAGARCEVLGPGSHCSGCIGFGEH
jgi:FAD binding domain